MNLLLRREQRSSVLGKAIFVLTVRGDLSAEEQSNISKYKLGDTILYTDTEIVGGSGLLGAASRLAYKAMRISVSVNDLANLAFTDEEFARIDAATGRGAERVEEKLARQREAEDRRQKTLREDLAYLSENRLTLLRTGAYTPEALASEELRLTQALAQPEEERASAAELRETASEVLKLSELLKTAKPYYDLAKPEKKERIARLVFSELAIDENTLDFRCTNGFRVLERRFFSESAG
jgi:hypothetical protein